MGSKFELLILLLLVLFASAHKFEAHASGENTNYQNKQQIEVNDDLSTARLLQNGGNNFPILSQDQGFNTQDGRFSDQNMQFGTFQDQPTTSQGSNSPQQSPPQNNVVVNNQQNQKSTTQNQAGTNSNQNGQNPSLVPPKKQQPKILLTQIQKPVLGKGLKINQGISYQRLHVGKLQKKFLFIDFILAEKDKWQKVNISIAMQGSDVRIIQCQYDGHDSCYIPSASLKANSILFLNIHCQDECIYNLNSHWSDLQHLIPGTSYIFSFGKQTFQLYHVELQDREFQEFRVHVAPRTTRRPFDNIKIYGKYGSDTGLTTSDFDFQSINLWQDGEGLFLRSSDLKSKNFDLLLIGQTQSTYKLVCELIKQPNRQIVDGQHLYEYMKARESKIYHISTFDTKRFQQFSLKVSVLTGNVEVQYFYDKDLKKNLPFTPFKYMDDSQYIFQANQIAQFASNGLYVKMTSKEMEGQPARDATFTIKFQGRQKSDAIQLNEHVYGFVSVNQTKFAYFNFKRWLQQTQTNLKFTVSALQVLGDSKLQFFICKDKLHTCTDPQKYTTVTEPIPKGKNYEEISQKQRYQFQITDSYLKKINSLEQEGIIVVRITDEAEKGKGNSFGFNLVALQFINNNKVLNLREGRPLEDKLAANEMKIYKYINSDENVKEIRIHVNEIAGVIKLSGAIKDPFSQKTENVQPQGTTLRFVKNLTQPILVAIRAEQKSIFGISMQIILKGQVTGVADVRAIGQDLAYTVRINPNSYTIFEVTPMFYEFRFKYESSQSIMACVVSYETGECIQFASQDKANIQNVPRPSEKGELTKAALSKQRRARVKITNPFSDSAAQVTVIFHSRLFDHCDQKKIGKAYSQNVKNGTCYTFLYQSQENNKGLQMYISKRQLANMSYSVLICGNSIKDAFKLKTLILSTELINEQCKNNLQTKQISIYWYVNTNNVGVNDISVKVDYVVQKIGGVVILPEGLSYSVLTRARDGVIKTFGYSLINLVDTRVYIHPTIGRFRAFAKLIREDDRDSEQISEINYHFNSVSAMSYDQEPIIVVPKKKMEEAKCERCFLLIAVYTDSEQGRTVQFQIQVVQRFQSLNDDSSVKGYLQAGSTAYYTYRAKESNNKEASLIFFLSDHHQRCANMYLHYHQYPGPNFNIQKAFESNELIYNHKGPQTKYFLAVQAKKTCEYTLSILQYDTSIHRLQRGKQNMLKLLKGEVRYFTFEQYTDEPFKILSLSRFGQVRLHLNVSGIAIDKRTYTTEQLDVQKFEVKSQNPNALAISTSDKIHCKNCNYFLAAEAVSTTFATLFLVYPTTIIPFYKNKFFSDYFLKKNDITLASYNSLEKSKLQVVVHSGSIQITAAYKQYRSSQTFLAKSDVQTMKIEISEDIIKGNNLPRSGVDPYFNSMKNAAIAYQEKIPINFIIKALSDKSIYTLQVKSLPTKGDLSGFTEYQNIKSGEPNHIEVSNEKVLCLNGVINDDEQILLTTNSDNQDRLKKLVFNAKVRNNTNAKVKTQILKNVVSIKLEEQNTKDKPAYGVSSYQVCLKLDTTEDEEEQQQKEQKKSEKEKEALIKQEEQKNITQAQSLQNFDQEDNVTFKAVVTQANSVNIVPSDTETLVKGTQTFVVHSDGQFILDVFECQGESKVSYSDSLASLKSSKPKLIQSVSISEQKHAVRVSQSDTTFINVTSKHALIRWLPLNVQTDQGSGYLRFEAGDIRYSSKFKYINIEYQPLQLKKKTKSKVSQIKYVLYISNDSQILEYNAQCSPHKPKDVIQIEIKEVPFKSSPQDQKQYFGYGVQKTQLQNRFNGSDNIYFTIVAKLVLQVSKKVEKNPKFETSISNSREHYRFIYSRQQMPLQTYKPSTIQAIPYGYLALIVGSILLVLVFVTFLFTRKIAPWIARLRSRHLVEDQDPAQNKQDLQIIPPSSDRNQRAPENALQTEEKMKS